VTHSSPEVLFKTCVAMKFVDDDDDAGRLPVRIVLAVN